jgi:TctA family transporter
MLAGLSELGQAYLSILNVYSLAYGLGGALLGIIVGCLPGLSATLCIALLTTLTIKMAPNDAILILICSYVGTLYGGSRTAILLNIPGTAANAASCADGHALALRGEAGRAIGIATSGAFSGTLFGVLCLAAFTPLLAEVSLSFGAYEFFWLALLGVAMSGSIVGNDPLKGWLMGTLGLFVAQIGQEGLYAHDRFTFGWSQLSGGISLIPALVGAFGFAEVLTTLADPVERQMVEMRDSVLPRFREVFQYWRTVLRSGVIGVMTGLMPGVGEDAGAWMSYAAAKAVSKEKEQFGKGSIDGLMAAETGDMSSIPGHIIPALAWNSRVRAICGFDGRHDHPRHSTRADADDRTPAIHLRRGGHDITGDRQHPGVRAVSDQTAVAGAQDQAHCADAHHLLVVHGRRFRQRLSAVRYLLHVGDRNWCVLPTQTRISDGALCARTGPRRPAGQKPAPGSGTIGWQSRAIFYPTDQHRFRYRDDPDFVALYSSIQVTDH